MRMKLTICGTLIVLAHTSLALFAWANERIVPESAPVARGAAYAAVKGCIECHGDPDYPLADDNDKNCSDVNEFSWHPEYDVECTDVMAYFESVRLRRNFKDRAQASSTNLLMAGERLARTYHCFQCHGQMGQGGFRNDRSLKGYVPGYFGSDFRLLTRDGDPASVREWIMHGVDPTIVEQPLTGWLAAFYFNRQAVSMPLFKSLPPDDIEVLVAYVIALNGFGPMDAGTVRRYGELSRLSFYDEEGADYAYNDPENYGNSCCRR